MLLSQQLSLFEERPPEAPDEIGAASVSIRPNAKVLNIPKGALEGVDYALNPYVGCSFGCSYCYAANFIADDARRAAWGTWVDVKANALKELSKADLRGKTMLMSSATDPYQPIEAKLCHTRAIVELLSEPSRQPRFSVQTRSPLVTRDLDLLARFEYSRVGMSITTDSEDIRKAFEPNCASIERRFAALETVAAAGVPVAVCIAPILPIRNPAAFAKRIAALKPKWVFAQKFHRTERPFTSDTRPEAFEIARQVGWTQREYHRTIAELKRWLPDLREGKGGYLPP